jgi:hypothetical protein
MFLVKFLTYIFIDMVRRKKMKRNLNYPTIYLTYILTEVIKRCNTPRRHSLVFTIIKKIYARTFDNALKREKILLLNTYRFSNIIKLPNVLFNIFF